MVSRLKLGKLEFRYNHRIALGVDDSARTRAVLRGIKGKRLTYKDSFGASIGSPNS